VKKKKEIRKKRKERKYKKKVMEVLHGEFILVEPHSSHWLQVGLVRAFLIQEVDW